MADHLQHELKKEFQLERMILFSDAVFAIAITLLVIEIKVPPIDRHIATNEMLLKALDEMVPKFVGFFLSFFIIGGYWVIHHRIFGYVVNYDRRLLWINLFFLMAIVLMPFSTAFFSEYILRRLQVPIAAYAVNVVFLGIMDTVLCLYISHFKKEFTEGLTPYESRFLAPRAILMTVVSLLIALAFLFVDIKKMVWVPLLLAVILRIVMRFFFKKRKSEPTHE